ncbi:MAG: SH3 domain-containing protein [Anaerolineae bacterium]
MRQIHSSRLIDLVLILFLLIGMIGYTASADVPLVSARSEQALSLRAASSQAELLQTSKQLVVIAFSDTTGAGPFECPGCDKIFSSEDQEANANNPLPAMEFVVRNARTGAELGRQQATLQPQGRYRAIFQIPETLEDDIVLSLVSTPSGFDLCPNASSSRTITPEDFVLGTHEEIYPFWTSCPLEAPTATPVPPSATPIPPTPTPAPPTATPMPPTATLAPTATLLPERSIVVEAFVDVTGPGGLQCPGCDRIFSSSDQAANAVDPLPDIDFILREADTGRLLARQTTTIDTQGRARTRFLIPAGFDKALRLELASMPDGYQLCPNIGPTRAIEPEDFILGTHLEQYPFWKGCQLPEPTVEPSPVATATPQPSPTSPSPTLTPATSPTPTSTPTALPEGALNAVVTAQGLNVRTGPGIEYTRLGAVAGGTKLTLSGRNEAGTWVRGRAEEENLEGWLSAKYMQIDGDVMTLPILEIAQPVELEATPTILPVDMLSAVVTARGLNVRTGPGIEYARLGAVAGETELSLTGRNEDGTWVRGRAEEENLEGWLSAKYMRIDGDVNALPVLEVIPAGELQTTPTEPAATATPTPMVIPQELPRTGSLDIPVWGLMAMAAALLLALSHVWRWVRNNEAVD